MRFRSLVLPLGLVAGVCTGACSEAGTPAALPAVAGQAGTLGVGVAGTGGGAGTSGAGGAAVAGTGGLGGSDGGSAGVGGMSGAGGSGGADTGGSSGSAGSSGDSGAAGAPSPPTELFSFFVTSIEIMRELSDSEDGFGGDLRFGEETGLEGADKICTTVAERAMPGAGLKGWRAFLSTSAGGPDDGPVNAIERIGEGPWYDRVGRLVAMDIEALLAGPRPEGADPAIINDLPNERGEPNHQGVDNHDTITGSNRDGEYDPDDGPGGTCNDWTSAVGNTGRPMIGHSWPRNAGNLGNGGHWLSDHPARGCAPGVNLESDGGGSGNCIGCGGGYGGLYCFALLP